MTHLVSVATGEIVSVGRHVKAVEGPHAGTWWRISELFHDGTQHMVRATHRHTHVGRVPRTFRPDTFGLRVHEEISHVRHAVNTLHHTWQKLDEWLLAGVIALLPLAFFEQYHLAETITSTLGLGGH